MNSKIRTIVFSIAGILVLVGAVLYLTRWIYAPYLFSVGAAGITVCYMTVPVKDLDFRVRRLYRINVFAGIAMVLASVFMFKQQMEWVAFLLISALLQLYTSFVFPKEKK
jgi:hypothetical protein